MKYIINDRLNKNIPIEKKEFIKNKINSFIDEYYKNNKDITKMGHGWYVRFMKSTKDPKIYKFRVDRGDRILFTYSDQMDELLSRKVNGVNEKDIILLDYCKHDDQERISKSQNKMKASKTYKISTSYNDKNNEFDEKDIDKKIYEKYIKQNNYLNDISRIVTNENELENIMNNDTDEYLYVMNQEQYSIVTKEINPLFLFGSAGSGKTTIAVNKAYIKSSCNKVGFFTYSEKLVKRSEKIFTKICESEGLSKEQIEQYRKNIEFYSVNKYNLKYCKNTSYIKFEEFKEWGKYKFDKIGLDATDVWREIRGIIKGYIDTNLLDIYIDKKDISEKSIKILTSNKNLINQDEKKIYIKSIDIAKTCDILRKYNSNTNDIDKIYAIIDKLIYNNKLIKKETYLNLSDEYSIYNKQTRELIYKVAIEYQNWLNKERKLDDNDISKLVLEKISNTKNTEETEEQKIITEFDYIICDEVQDLTEIQILCIYKLLRNGKNLMMCGDFNQTINPTFFNTGRIESIFKIYNGLDYIDKQQININYRNTKDIVKLCNKITDLRIGKLGKTDYDNKEKHVRKSNEKIFFLDSTYENKKQIINTAINKHYANIIVPDEKEKENTKIYLNKENKDNGKFIFTVAEMKGIENDCIICVNVISRFKDKWDEIFNIDDTQRSKYRLYFNLLYVAITRAKKSFCFIEDDINNEVYREIKEFTKVINGVDNEQIGLDIASGAIEFYNRGKKLENIGEYEKAKSYYQTAFNKLDTQENIKLYEQTINKDITRCDALILEAEGKNESAAKKFRSIKEYDLAFSCYKKIKNEEKCIETLLESNLKFKEIEKKLTDELDIDIFNLLYKHKDKSNIAFKIYRDYCNKLGTEYSKVCSEIKVDIDEIIESIKC